MRNSQRLHSFTPWLAEVVYSNKSKGSSFIGDKSMGSIEQIRERVIQIVAKISMIDASEISADSSFESLGLDSLSRIEVLVELEREFEIETQMEDEQEDDKALAQILTVEDAAQLVVKNLAAKS